VISSINPANQGKELVAAVGPTGQPKIPDVPWHRNNRPKKIRNRLRTTGAYGLIRVSRRSVMRLRIAKIKPGGSDSDADERVWGAWVRVATHNGHI